MSAPACALEQVRATKTQPRVATYYAAAAYALLVVAVVQRHEPWADEAQAWLLGRDASLADLWTKLLHYEGSPGLWQTLLHVLIRLGLPYSGYNFVSAALGFSGIWIVLRYSPFPLLVRLSLPFTYYFFYQYSVVARSYALTAPLLFAIAILYDRATERPVLFHALLCLIAGISVHGVMVSACIWLTVYGPVFWRDWRSRQQRRLMLIAALYGLVLLFFMLCAWPAKDVAFAEERGAISKFRFFSHVTRLTLAEAFAGDWRASVALVALSARFLWRGGGWLFFLLVSASFFLFGTFVYAAVWHCGIFFLAWLFAIWISTRKTPLTYPVVGAMLAAIAVQCYWTVEAVRYDWNSKYSGSLEAARYLQQEPSSEGLYAIGYPTLALQPYFASNLYSDYNQRTPRSYWDWSKRNPAMDATALFSAPQCDRVLVGYTSTRDRDRWASTFRLLGYQQTQHFAGATFWRTHVFELQSYDLYRRAPAGSTQAVSSLALGDPASSPQLLSGFYAIEEDAWRWTAKNFAVVLKPLAGADLQGAHVNLQFYVSPGQIQTLGPLTLSADVNGCPLPAQTFSTPGKYSYSQMVPAHVLGQDLVAVRFHLDKAANGIKDDHRELGVVVSAVGFAVP